MSDFMRNQFQTISVISSFISVLLWTISFTNIWFWKSLQFNLLKWPWWKLKTNRFVHQDYIDILIKLELGFNIFVSKIEKFRTK